MQALTQSYESVSELLLQIICSMLTGSRMLGRLHQPWTRLSAGMSWLSLLYTTWTWTWVITL